jgi:hypothetical protein
MTHVINFNFKVKRFLLEFISYYMSRNNFLVIYNRTQPTKVNLFNKLRYMKQPLLRNLAN